jgi:hypothetical protein
LPMAGDADRRAVREVCELEANDRRSPIRRAIHVNDLPNQKRRARSLLSWHRPLASSSGSSERQSKKGSLSEFMACTEVCSFTRRSRSIGWVRRGASHNGPICMRPMTIPEFYRAESARCRDRAEKASTPERVARWRRVAEDCLRVAAELEAADGPVHKPAAMPSSRASNFRFMLKG